MAKLQGFRKQTPLYGSSRYIVKFRTSIAWVEHGRIMIIRESTGEFTSVDVDTWYDRMIALRNDAEKVEYADQRAQMVSLVWKMVELYKLARAQPQPPFVIGTPSAKDRKIQIVVPSDMPKGPPKPLYIPN